MISVAQSVGGLYHRRGGDVAKQGPRATELVVYRGHVRTASTWPQAGVGRPWKRGLSCVIASGSRMRG
jgi:hypothetical protein